MPWVEVYVDGPTEEEIAEAERETARAIEAMRDAIHELRLGRADWALEILERAVGGDRRPAAHDALEGWLNLPPQQRPNFEEWAKRGVHSIAQPGDA